MNFGANMQYFRKMCGAVTQEQLAEKMGVSRQMVSKWEAGEAYPEIEKILRLCELFSCSMDQLVREDMSRKNKAYSPVRIVTVERFRMARYVIVSPQPENDVGDYIRRWAKNSGLLDVPGYELDIIGWDFPYVSAEQQNIYGLRGYAAACVIPDDFVPKCPGAELAWQEQGQYAAVTITEPFAAAFELIPGAYQFIMKSLEMNGIKKRVGQDLACFERVYQKDNVCYMDVYIATDAMTKTAEVFSLR